MADIGRLVLLVSELNLVSAVLEKTLRDNIVVVVIV